MRIKISKNLNGGVWYNKAYLRGRTCEVLAVHKRDGQYFVLHPITKILGYWIHFAHCKVIEYKPQVPSWDAFLKCNVYGYSK